MPTINIAPKAMQNGDNVTVYKDTVGPQQQTYTFLTSQERVILKNSGSKNITYTVGSQSGSLGPSQSVEVKETITSINLTAEQGTQQFEIWADESGTKGISPEAVQSLGDQVSSFTTQLADIASKTITYDVFPDSTTIGGMANNTVFTTRGYYTKGDGFGSTYMVFSTVQPNSIQIGTKYIVAITQPVGEIYLPYYGIRTGSSYAVSNSAIMSALSFAFGALVRFPSGHFYFDQTINIYSNQIKLMGVAPVGYNQEVNGNGLTWLHFPNLTNGQAGITVNSGGSTISNILFYGNPSTYNLSIDRTKTVVAPDSIVTEISTVTTYAINAFKSCDIQNCGFMNFYYGIYSATGNTTINNIFGYYCHYLVSIGNDTKVSRIFGWNCMVVLQIRGDIASATTIRGDSIGEHLVHITKGKSIYLSDLDADYCVKSILHLGGSGNIGNLLVDGMHGRSSIYRAYDSSTTSEPTASVITTTANVEEYPIISIKANTNVTSARFVLMGYGAANPMDATSTYLTPTILIASDINTVAQNIEIILIGSLGSSDTTPLTPTWISNRIQTLSSYSRSLEIAVKTAFDTILHKQNGNSVGTYTKVITQGTALTDSIVTLVSYGVLSPTTGVIRVSPTTAVNNISIQAGTYSGQEVTLINEAVSANTITFASSGSNVADGSSNIINGLTARKFVWDASTSLWYRTS
jgi:hypothetical protein